MKVEQKSWTRDSYSKHLRRRAKEDVSAAPAKQKEDPLLVAYREAAAVVSDFDPISLKPAGIAETQPGDFMIILPESEHVIGKTGRWTLHTDIRAKTLRRLLSESRLKAVVKAASPEPDDVFYQLLKHVVTGRGVSLTNQGETELSLLLALSKMIGSDVPGLPAQEDIKKELGRARLLAPMRHVADEHFRGRDEELEQLRNYVGVADPETVSGSLFRKVREVLDLQKRPPLMIFGPGGMGKSALTSRFVLEHANLDEDQRFPFAYLDFDRPGITAREPLTLLAEMLVQLGVQYPAIQAECAAMRRDLNRQVAWAFSNSDSGSNKIESIEGQRGISSSGQEREMYIFGIADLFQKIALENQPLLLVLDTFEEVQHHSRSDIPELFNFLQLLQEALPRLRVVLAGRTRETDEKVKPLALEPLDDGDARALMESHGVPAGVARMIVSKLGGNPLTLRLAMKVYKRDGLEAGDLDEMEGGRSFFSSVDDELVQGQLYRRFLNHIKDKAVQAVAHPGLVLRRLTPDLIFKVLAGPCELQISSVEDAQNLFNRLAQQDTLVSWEGGAIVHRSDVRRIMVELLRKAEKEKVEAIHAGAVDYYEPFDDVISRAEEIYHRYCLGQDEALIEGRWMAGIEDRLRPAISEVPEDMRSHLAARTGGEALSDQDWKKADLADWELHAARRARQLNDHARYEEALELLQERNMYTDASVLHNLKVVALARLGELQQARETGEKALQSLRQAGNRLQELEIMESLGSVARRQGDFEAAQAYLFAATELAEKDGEVLRAVESLVLALESGEWAGSNLDRDEIRGRMADLIQRLEPRQIIGSPVLFTRIAVELEEFNSEISGQLREILGESFVETATVTGKNLSGSDRKRVEKAMLDVFKGPDDLELFVRKNMDVSLRNISATGSLQSTVFDLIGWAQANGRLEELIEAVQKEVSENSMTELENLKWH